MRDRIYFSHAVRGTCVMCSEALCDVRPGGQHCVMYGLVVSVV